MKLSLNYLMLTPTPSHRHTLLFFFSMAVICSCECVVFAAAQSISCLQTRQNPSVSTPTSQPAIGHKTRYVHTLKLPASSPNTMIICKKRKIKPPRGRGPFLAEGGRKGWLETRSSEQMSSTSNHCAALCFLFSFHTLKVKKIHKITKQHKVLVAKFMISPWLDWVLDDAAVRKCASGADEMKGCDVIRSKVTTSELSNLGNSVWIRVKTGARP